MKSVLACCLALCFAAFYSPAFSAEENENADAGKLSIETIIASCEQEYTVESYPDEEERNKMVEQCIEQNSASSTE